MTDENGKAYSATIKVMESEGAVSTSIDDVTEQNFPSPLAEFGVTWSASDTDNDDLDIAEFTLSNKDGSHTEEPVTEDISGGIATVTTTLKAKFDKGTGNDNKVTLIVTDTDENRTDRTQTTFTEV